ncbi:Retrovirus-related Pol polyprotein from transposon TNT 1-94 [Eumeta japonica]|uniref:Retrovirus-related Pol polyprotein from transposon TNT 1-94 n=1 Tax=Eumeta variegata TaxID=151549 RepID=A0A4C1VPY8_EUMVA|nr:Retrovirus-related Pol polyprotein from transposon TNT 1-94 [Eumeta japonica]
MDTAKNCRAPKKTTVDNTEENKGFVAAFSASPQTINLWCVDSGASMHMTNRQDWIYDVTSPPIPTITVASKTPLSVKSMGKMLTSCQNVPRESSHSQTKINVLLLILPVSRGNRPDCPLTTLVQDFHNHCSWSTLIYVDQWTKNLWEQNALAERMNRALVERAKYMLFDAQLAKQFWAEALTTVAYIINRSPTKSVNGKTPMEIWTGKKPNLSNLKVFGCEVKTQVPKEKRQKWDSKSRKLLFVGYCESTKGYRILDPDTNKIIKNRDVIFLENVEKYNNNIYLPCTSDSNSPEIQPLEETCKEELVDSIDHFTSESSEDNQSGEKTIHLTYQSNQLISNHQ